MNRCENSHAPQAAEEIRAEGLTRSIENFSRFLEVAGLKSGEQINFTAAATDAGFPPRTVREHYQILEDTLVGYQLPAYQKTSKRKPVATVFLDQTANGEHIMRSRIRINLARTG